MLLLIFSPVVCSSFIDSGVFAYAYVFVYVYVYVRARVRGWFLCCLEADRNGRKQKEKPCRVLCILCKDNVFVVRKEV